MLSHTPVTDFFWKVVTSVVVEWGVCGKWTWAFPEVVYLESRVGPLKRITSGAIFDTR